MVQPGPAIGRRRRLRRNRAHFPGCFSQGETVEKTLARTRDAIAFSIEDMLVQGEQKHPAIRDEQDARLLADLDRLAKESTAGGVLKGELSGLRRLRAGSYRIIYQVFENQLIILVVQIGDRRGIYDR